MVLSVLLLVLMLQIKHLFFDFFWQSNWMATHKGTYGHPAGLVHAGLHGFGTGLVLMVVPVPIGLGAIAALSLAETVLHYHIDWVKSRVTRRAGVDASQKRFWVITGTDQALHQATYLAIAGLVFS
ncbi:DUF3307 domain-containing protein [Tropicimonas sp. S265A]|uniref:DUF3307 domain-containing protein n=1 Tax=Tropicimonas sp. S265A TaxID=3415134 RepID=UPI003C7A7806